MAECDSREWANVSTADAGELIFTGPLLLAVLIAMAAGAVSFFSPCCLPLVPGFLALVAGTAGAEVTEAATADGAHSDVLTNVAVPVTRTLAGALLFVGGFSAVFVAYGAAFGSLGATLGENTQTLTKILGLVTIVLGLSFAGVLTRIPWLQRTVRVNRRPKWGLMGAPLLGVLFALGWTPCIGPTLAAVLTLSLDQASAWRGAFLAFMYSVGLGLPFVIAAVLFQRGLTGFGWARRHAASVMRFGGFMLVTIGILQVTGGWTYVIGHLRGWISGYSIWL